MAARAAGGRSRGGRARVVRTSGRLSLGAHARHRRRRGRARRRLRRRARPLAARRRPEPPEAWLLTAARRRLLDRWRHGRVRGRAPSADARDRPRGRARAPRRGGEPSRRAAEADVRLRAPGDRCGVRTPLMLQTVLGLDAARDRPAFLVAPATMGQRLVRAKRKIRAGRHPLRSSRARRAAGAARGGAGGDLRGLRHRLGRCRRHRRAARGLADEAHLARARPARLLPSEPEASGCSP